MSAPAICDSDHNCAGPADTHEAEDDITAAEAERSLPEEQAQRDR